MRLREVPTISLPLQPEYVPEQGPNMDLLQGMLAGSSFPTLLTHAA